MEAVRVYRESPGAFDCVVLDIAMPGMDGPEVFDALKIIDPSVKVVIASGYSQQQAEEKLGHRRPDAVMQKPFRIDKLTAILKSIPIGWDGLQG
jgi:CheY-like chemotaxis protein